MKNLQKEIEENFTFEVTRCRNELGLTQEQAAEAINISTRWLQSIESGRIPSAHTTLRIISVLEIDGKNLKVRVSTLV